jgi:hypothetical protein
VQKVGSCANFSESRIGYVGNVLERSGHFSVVFELFLKRRYAHFQRCKGLPANVVKVTGHFASLVILSPK